MRLTFPVYVAVGLASAALYVMSWIYPAHVQPPNEPLPPTGPAVVVELPRESPPVTSEHRIVEHLPLVSPAPKAPSRAPAKKPAAVKPASAAKLSRSFPQPAGTTAPPPPAPPPYTAPVLAPDLYTIDWFKLNVRLTFEKFERDMDALFSGRG